MWKCLLAALCWVVASLTGVAAETPKVEHVFIISFDGGGGAPGVIERHESMPVFKRLFAEGASTWSARTIFPSITLPSHTSMLTGVGPDKHKILWNDWKPDKGLVTVPTVFSLAKEKGLCTAMFVGKPKFKHLNLPGSVDLFFLPEPKGNAKAVAAAVAENLPKLKPNLCFIHFADPDSTGHKYGWGSPEQTTALIECDQALGTILDAIRKAGLADSSVVILTADHGGHDKTHGSAEQCDMNIPWVAWGRGVKPGSLSSPITTYDTAATALWLLNVSIPADWDGKPVREAFAR